MSSNASLHLFNETYDLNCGGYMQSFDVFDLKSCSSSLLTRRTNYTPFDQMHDFKQFSHLNSPQLTTFRYWNITHFKRPAYKLARLHIAPKHDDKLEVSATQNTVTTTRLNNHQINQDERETNEEHKSYTIIYKDSPATTVLLIIIAVLLVIKVFGNKILHCFSQGGNTVNAPRDNHVLRGRLNPEDEQMIQNNYVYLREQIEPLDIIAYLFQEKVLDRDDLEVIRNTLTRTERADTLLRRLLNAGPGSAFAVFMRALENQYGHVVRHIRNNG
ncbi:Immune-associated nucleotide-binding protein 12 [Biomphalaria glabrata]